MSNWTISSKENAKLCTIEDPSSNYKAFVKECKEKFDESTKWILASNFSSIHSYLLPTIFNDISRWEDTSIKALIFFPTLDISNLDVID